MSWPALSWTRQVPGAIDVVMSWISGVMSTWGRSPLETLISEVAGGCPGLAMVPTCPIAPAPSAELGPAPIWLATAATGL